MRLNLEQVRRNIEAATTEDLLDRATIYRDEMEPEALALIDRALEDRGVRWEDIQAHEERRRQQLLTGSEGEPLKCSRCQRPAIGQTWGWHRLWGVLPLFPRRFTYCEVHQPASGSSATP